MKTNLIKAVLFDFDGTLSLPGTIDFQAIKNQINCPKEIPVLEFIENLPTKNERQTAHHILEQYEDESAALSKPNKDAEKIIRYLRKLNIPLGVITRNRLSCVHRSLKNFIATSPLAFDTIITRETPVKTKPSGEGILLFAQKFSIDPNHILVVGDYWFDIQAGINAGSITVLIDNGDSTIASDEIRPDFRVSCLNELKEIIDCRLPLHSGKLPNHFLEPLLNQLNIKDPSLLIPPHVGEDTAAMDIQDESVLVLKSDPITFTTTDIGRFAVLINANDIATSGATPRWFLSTLLFPKGVSALDILDLIKTLHDVCSNYGITLCGGHTEVTSSVKRPVVVGMMAGTVSRKELRDKRNVKKGDRILLTKRIAVEGTAIIANEFEEKLLKKGVDTATIRESKHVIRHISILPEARVASSVKGVTAMHDITEGGFATAIREFAVACQHDFLIHLNKVPIYHNTQRICDAMDIHPLGLIGSGSLLIICTPEDHTHLIKKLEQENIEITDIGEVLDKGRNVEIYSENDPSHLPFFKVDEITTLFE